MLHQILCALQGKTGSIIKKYQNQISVDPSINYLSKPQIQLINQICKCGYYYHKIITLINAQSSYTNLTFSMSTPSIYRKAMYQGLKLALNQYVQLILAIQQQFLRNRHFTFANIRAQLQPFQLIMKQISQIIIYIHNQHLKGGSVVNYLYNRYQNSNLIVRNWLQKMIKSTIRVFINQVSMWILYGQIQDSNQQFFIHRVITQGFEKYKFKSKAGKNIQITDWDMFTLQESMVPSSLIQLQTAGKILFIGKAIKILKSANKIPTIPDNILLDKINIIGMMDYSQIAFQGLIQQVRQVTARKMIEFIMKEQNLIKQLQKLNDYYLMFKGDFYHHFFEETKGMQTISLKEKVQKKINDVYLHNTFIRLGQHQDIKRLQFQLNTSGFNYSSFKNFTNICPVGKVDLTQEKFIRFNNTGSAIWNRRKQIIENNFTMVFSFNFKKIKQITEMNKNKRSRDPTYLNIVIQNSNQVAGSIHHNLAYLNRISQYVALKIGFCYSQQEKNYVSSMILVKRDANKQQKQILLSQCVSKNLNFLQQKSYQVKFSYFNDIFKAQIFGKNTQKGELRADKTKLSNCIDFQMGRAYLGMVSTINQSDFVVELQNWEMICQPITFSNNYFNDLQLNFKIEWPISLIINQDLIQAYSRIHKFLFPIRYLQIQIQSIWFQIPRLIKTNNKTTPKQQIRELRYFERRLAAFRSSMNLFINNLWSYFQADIAQYLWSNLVTGLECNKDFDGVIQLINKYVKKIEQMYFFNKSTFQSKIGLLLKKLDDFKKNFNKIVNEGCIDPLQFQNLQQTSKQFNQLIQEFYKQLKSYSSLETSQYVYHFTKRINNCRLPSNIAQKDY